MIDLKKKPIPPRQSYENLARVISRIADKQSERDKVVKALEEEHRRTKIYKNYWTQGILIAIIVDALNLLIMTVKDKSTGLLGAALVMFAYIWGILGSITLTFILVKANPSVRFRSKYDDRPVKAKGQWWKKIIYYILAGVPWYSCLVIRFRVDMIQAIWIAPVSLVALCLLMSFNASHGNPMRIGEPTSQDYKAVRVNQSLGGLNPDKVPIVMTFDNMDTIMRMDPQDWNYIGHQLNSAGYKGVLKKGR